MAGNGDKRPVGKCGICGGVVSLPRAWWSVSRAVPTCESCGAVADEAAMLPTLPMRPVKPWRPTPKVNELTDPRAPE